VQYPIVYGSTSNHIASNNKNQFRWTLYVHGQNIQKYVSKVVFSLHPTFMPPVREVTETPFQFTATRWGKFKAHITLYFKSLSHETGGSDWYKQK
jgi:transcription initiation factor IIF auxiliary subunit